MSQQSQDQKRVAHAARGDAEAFRALYQEHARPVYWIAYGIVQSAADAEDVTQETFVTAWKKLPTLTLVGESALPWLATICRYSASNLLRKRMRERARQSDTDLDAVPSIQSIEESAITSELLDKITQAIGQLTPLDRKILELCAIEGYAYDAAARSLGITHATVRNRLSRTRRHLRATIHEEVTP